MSTQGKEQTMKNLRLFAHHPHLLAKVGVLSLLWALLGAMALLQPSPSAAEDQQDFAGAAYLITVSDAATGSFASRGVIALHADGTMSVTDSGQGGPSFFFSSQLGSWTPDTQGGVKARTIDFDYPPAADVARLDYALHFVRGGRQIAGTVTLTTFPLTGNPLGSGGTVVGMFTISGDLVTP